MECVCFKSACGSASKSCQINVTKSASLRNISVSTVICLLLTFMVALFYRACWVWLCTLSLIACSYLISHCSPQSECVVAVSGVGMYITKSFGPLTSSSVFIPQTATQDIIIFEAISKYQIDFTLAICLSSTKTLSQQDILVPLFKTSSTVSLKDIQVAYTHLKHIFDKT